MDLGFPRSNQAVDTSGSFLPSWVSFFTKIRTYIIANSQSGTTAQRPTTGLSPGDRYMDLTLGYPVFVKSVNPVVWVNGSGAVV